MGILGKQLKIMGQHKQYWGDKKHNNEVLDMGSPANNGYSWSELSGMTDDFNKDKLVVQTEFFKVYRGKLDTHDVTVKIWDDSLHLDHKLRLLQDESLFLARPEVSKSPNVVKLMAYCCDGGHVGAVYKLNSVSTLQQLFPVGSHSTHEYQWRDRVTVILGIARLFEFLDSLEMLHLIHNEHSLSVIVDEETNPVLYDIGMWAEFIQLVEGAEDSSVNSHASLSNKDGRMKAHGIFLFCILLLRLIGREDVISWSRVKEDDYADLRLSNRTTHECFRMLRANTRFLYHADYIKICSLAVGCLSGKMCPTMSKVVLKLENLLLFSVPVRTSVEKVLFGGYPLLGKAYRGKIPHDWKGSESQDVVVKIWEHSQRSCLEANIRRFRDELLLLTRQWMIDQPNTAKLLGYCFDHKSVGVVYSLKPLGTLESLFDDDTFKWEYRIKVLLDLARLLELLQCKNPVLVVRNLCGAHVMIDQDKKPVLYDYSMLTSHDPSRGPNVHNVDLLGCAGYIDPYFANTGDVTPQSDIYAFGVLLALLISKQCAAQVRKSSIDGSLQDKCSLNGSLAHESFVNHAYFNHSDGQKLSVLALRCLRQPDPRGRPRATEIIEQLLTLSIFHGKAKIFHSVGNVR